MNIIAVVMSDGVFLFIRLVSYYATIVHTKQNHQHTSNRNINIVGILIIPLTLLHDNVCTSLS